jgi:DNA repair protein RadA/Sms
VIDVSKIRTLYRCRECGHAESKWAGRCNACGEWSTLEEEVSAPVAAGAGVVSASPADVAQPIDQIDFAEWAPAPTGLPEVDRVLGGGLVPGSVTLLHGEPGIGKSTLLLQIVCAVAAQGRRALYCTAEESKQQVRLRAERLGTLHGDLWLASETDLANVLHHIAQVKPELVVVDSIQTIADPSFSSAPGTVVQVRECANRLVQVAKSTGVAIVLVGHVTKEGALAGPRVLEHLVDTVIGFEGDRQHAFRVLRAAKHRFGSTDEVGVFEMREQGLVPVADPSSIFLADRAKNVSGSIVLPTIDGHRPLLVEVQALIVDTGMAFPRRSAEGVDLGRLNFLLAVLEKRAGVRFDKHDVYALAVGGIRVTEPGADLALCLALASARRDTVLPPDLVACGEVGLGGELRRVTHLERRLLEAARLGLKRAIVPANAPSAPPGVVELRAATLAEALALAGIDRPARSR